MNIYPRITDADPAACPVCGYIPVVVVIESDDQGEYIGCATCKRPFRRVGACCRWRSPDGHSMMMPGTEPLAVV